MKRVILAVTVLALITAGVLTSRAWRSRRSADRRSNIVLIVLDTVRADRLGCHGNPTGLTPNLDRFATSATRFDRAFSPAPWTLPAVASLYTARHPTQHGAGGYMNTFRALPPDAVTIAEVFQGAGVPTRAIVNVLFLTDRLNMTQGFDLVDADAPETNTEIRRADATTDLALRWLDELDEGPFFLLVHYFDPHLVYDPPQPYRRRFAAPEDRETSDYVFGTRSDVIGMRASLRPIDAATVARLEKLYDGEVAFVDAEVGRLLEGLAARGLDANTVVAIVADHGEEFWDHRGFEHGHTHYDELLHVPLMIRAPAGASPSPGRVVNSTVRLIDVAPTLCELADVPSDPAFAGRSLVPLLNGKVEPDRPVVAEGNFWGPSRDSLRYGDHKVIRFNLGELAEVAAAKGQKIPESLDLRTRYELYDLVADPDEHRNLADANPLLRDRLIGQLDLALAAMTAAEATPADLTAEEQALLESLGYISPTSPAESSSRQQTGGASGPAD